MNMRQRSFGCKRLLISGLMLVLAVPALAQPVPLQRVIELALQNHGALGVAVAEQRKSLGALREARDMFLPAVTFGSGLGYSSGVPLSIEGSAPTIFNVTTQQFLFNMPQRSMIQALRVESKATNLNLEDKRDAVILDSALAYIELDAALGELKALGTQQKSAERVVFISSERIKEGVDSELDLKKSQLSSARVKLRMAQVMGNVDVLRERLARMTGLPAASIETVSDSIPKTEEIPQDVNYAPAAIEKSPAVRMAEQHARSAELRAKAEAQGKLPSVDLASQYAMLARFNNYDEFYRKYQRNNYSLGVNIRFPIFNSAQNARADQANQEAVKAKKELDNVRAQVTEQTLKLQRSLRQLSAAAEVARLDYEVADASTATVEVRLQSGKANSRDMEQARIEASDKFLTYQETNLDYVRTNLQLLRMIGALQKWAGQ